MQDKKEIINQIVAHSKAGVRQAFQEDIVLLRSLGFPECAIQFYKESEPVGYVEINSVRLWSIGYILLTNRDCVPGANIAPKGFVVFAENDCGDAYCFNLTKPEDKLDPEIVLIPHDVDFEDATVDEIRQYCKLIARNFEEFLYKFAYGKLETEPFYP